MSQVAMPPGIAKRSVWSHWSTVVCPMLLPANDTNHQRRPPNGPGQTNPSFFGGLCVCVCVRVRTVDVDRHGIIGSDMDLPVRRAVAV